MSKRFFASAVAAGIVAIGLGCALPASAAFIYVTYGTGVTGYTLDNSNSNKGIALSGTPFDFSFGTSGVSFTNAFSAVTDTNGNVYVGDAGANRVLKFSSAGAYQSTFTLTTDSSALSPQQIEIDTAGNLYTLNFAGEIKKFSATAGGIPGTTTSSVLATIPGARGIVVRGTDMYVSTSSVSGAGIYKIAGITTTPVTSLIYTTAAYPAGQLRGLDARGSTLYFADSTWSNTGGIIQAIDLTSLPATGAATTVVDSTQLNGPNSIILNPNARTPSNNAVTVMYIADYYAQRVTLYDISGTTSTLRNANFITTKANGSAFGSGVTGLAVSRDIVAIGDEYFPELSFFPETNQITQTPEPGTWALFGSAMLMMFWVRSSQAKRQPAVVRK